LLEEVWKELGRAAQGHHFDFVAVVAYVLRWDMMERWTHHQPPKAEERFAELAQAALGDHIRISQVEAAHG